MAEVVSGIVEKIVYRNAENNYTVCQIAGEDEDIVCVGYFTSIDEGDTIEAEGSFTDHRIYGEQFIVSSYQIKEPEGAEAIRRYLASGVIKGIGEALALRIVKAFGDDTFRIMESEPERLVEVRGISERKAREISEQFEEKRELREAMLFLQQYQISNNLAAKIYKQYGSEMMKIVTEDPYRLAEDIRGVGFKTADEIARQVGIDLHDPKRMKAGILHTITQAAGNGHTYLPEEQLFQESQELLGITEEEFGDAVTDLLMERRLIRKRMEDGEQRIYHASFYYMEMHVARKLLDLSMRAPADEKKMKARVDEIEKKNGIRLEEMQRRAVYEAVQSGLVIITGGPGTGKTTTINAMIRLFEAEQMEILLAAPTGRAAKRMTETTGIEAQTIHRLLEISGNPENGASMVFERNEDNPLEADAIIIDEMSMVDISLMYALLKAVPVGTRLILVGDVNQLPSVGPGNVLKDIIATGLFDVVRLSKIFRQAAESDIIMNAHHINRGEPIALDNKSKDFFMLKRDDVLLVERVIISLVMEKLPRYLGVGKEEIQVLTPMRRGELGVENLNRLLQRYLNPPEAGKREKQYGETLFREGDKVMQIRNNYQITWEVRSSYGTVIRQGSGIFNGDCGVIREVNEFAETLTVEFDESRMVEYPFAGLDELELAYAITIHKSQGSEYPAVVLPLMTGPRMLLNRNLLYTAVTRAKQLVAIVGSEQTVEAMIENESEMKRYSGLCDCILEMHGRNEN